MLTKTTKKPTTYPNAHDTDISRYQQAPAHNFQTLLILAHDEAYYKHSQVLYDAADHYFYKQHHCEAV